MTFAAARQVAAHLHIDVGDDAEHNNMHMEFPINTWLHDNGKLDIKSANIEWPRGSGERGIIFISKFCQVYATDSGNIMEDESDIEVKKWLEEQGAMGLRWVSFLDTQKITLGGIQPQRCDIKWGGVLPWEEFHARYLAKPVKKFVSPPG